MSRTQTSNYERIYRVVKQIPPGKVATYGDVASLAGLAGCARQVGYALHALAAGSRLPWQRVVNARGEVSARRDPEPSALQRGLLEAEGVSFGSAGRIDLERFRWSPQCRA